MTSLAHVQRVRKLYKTILKLHRGLPEEVQSLGNNYVRDEFRRHKNCNDAEANIFMNEWTVINHVYLLYFIYFNEKNIFNYLVLIN